MLNIFRGRPYGRLLRQLDDARHTLITETAKAEEAAARATLAKAQIDRLEGWISEMDAATKRRHDEAVYRTMPPRPSYRKPPEPEPEPMPPHMHGYQPHPA